MPALFQTLLDVMMPSSAMMKPASDQETTVRRKVADVCGVPTNTRLVSFSTVSVREYSITGDEGPGHKSTPYPITLGWTYRRGGNRDCEPRRKLFANKCATMSSGSDASIMTISTRSSFSSIGMEESAGEEESLVDSSPRGEIDSETLPDVSGDHDSDEEKSDILLIEMEDHAEDEANFTYRLSIDEFESRRSGVPPRMWTEEERKQLLQSVGGWSRRSVAQLERKRKVALALAYARRRSRKTGGVDKAATNKDGKNDKKDKTKNNTGASNANGMSSMKAGRQFYDRYVFSKYIV